MIKLESLASRVELLPKFLGRNSTPLGPAHSMFTSTGVSTDAGSSIIQVRLIFVGGLSPTRTTDVCVDSILIAVEDIEGTVRNRMMQYHNQNHLN